MSDESPQAVYRILDAAANRAGEGLRTIEEFARFVLDDAELTAGLKTLRHDLTAALSRLSRESLLAARDTTGDVGCNIGVASEYSRVDMAQVVAAAAVRTQQSLRVLEEYGKTIDALLATEVEQIRYRCYSLSAEVESHVVRVVASVRTSRLDRSRLYVLIDVGPSQEAYVDLVNRLFQGAVDVLQLRDRDVDDRTLIHRARLGTEIARTHGKLFIMNDRADLAVASDADGVHVGQEELPAADARRIVGPDRLIGVSTHSIEQARRAVAEGADYIGCGPVFPGRTKNFEEYVGPSFLCEVADEIEIPAFAIGGIDRSNLDEVVEAGFHRVAVTGAVRNANDPVAAAAELRQRLST